jgi:hypothetical protein
MSRVKLFGPVRIIASIEDPAVIKNILAYIERRDAASPYALRAPPATSGGDSPWRRLFQPRTVPCDRNATTPFVHRARCGGLAVSSLCFLSAGAAL